MPWTAPQPPVSGTTITVAYAQTNIVDSQNHLRLMTGNADPPGADYAIISTSSSLTHWAKIPDAALADAKISKTNVGGTGGPNAQLLTGFYESLAGEGVGGGQPYTADWLFLNIRQNNLGAFHASQLAWDIASNTGPWVRQISSGVAGAWARMWTSANDGAGSGLDADSFQGNSPSAFALAANGVPSGMIAAFRTALAIPAGWSRFTDGDGRLLVGAGTTFSQTFTENTAAGANWTPFAGAGGFTGTAADSVNVTPSGSTAVSAATHQNALSIAAQTWTPVARVVVWAQKS